MVGWNWQSFYTYPFVASLRNQSSMLVSYVNNLSINCRMELAIFVILLSEKECSYLVSLHNPLPVNQIHLNFHSGIPSHNPLHI